MPRGEIRHFVPDTRPLRTQGGSVFRLHDQRSGLPIPEGREVILASGLLVDGKPHNIDEPRYHGPLPEPILDTTIPVPQYLPDGEN